MTDILLPLKERPRRVDDDLPLCAGRIIEDDTVFDTGGRACEE
jgi:hypothetical protein